MFNKTNKNNLIIIIILAAILGLAGGVAGGLWSRSYLGNQLLLGSEINFSRSGLGSQFIIRDAKKVVVEQNDTINEVVNSAGASMVGIFKKKTVEKKGKTEADNYYILSEEAGQGLVVTSDGWIITNYKIDAPANYLIITQDKKIFNIDKVVSDKLTPFSFIHVNAKDLPVKKFSALEDIKNGQLVVTVNWEGESTPLSILNNNTIVTGQIINSSDVFIKKIKLTGRVSDSFSGAPVFNLSGEVVGLSLGGDLVEPIHHFSSVLGSLQKNSAIKRASLGINYLDLSGVAGGVYAKGALIQKGTSSPAVIKGSAADLAGLKEADVIVAIEDTEPNKDSNLNDLIQIFLPGDEINITYIRNKVKKEVLVKLGG